MGKSSATEQMPPVALPMDAAAALPDGGALPEGTVKPRKRPSALTARPGEFMASYDWREVMAEGQTIPQGLEVMLSMNEGELTLARIPPKWRLQVIVEGPGDYRPLRMEVGSRTTLAEVQTALLALHPHLDATKMTVGEGEGWPVLQV